MSVLTFAISFPLLLSAMALQNRVMRAQTKREMLICAALGIGIGLAAVGVIYYSCASGQPECSPVFSRMLGLSK
ncbi:hypothetical protein [Achromobacter kerstersii]|uniref:hypothetical protein n=1 Tax=Achromobacter kerstersii TaxID=1353890 RepID=UPI001582E60E|nr:hypothetical protein [Achromobacter kerstersii]